MMIFLHALLLVMAAFLIVPGASAQACGDSGTGDPAKKCAAAGNPIDVISGNKFQREVDLPALPGVMGLEVVRYYNSSLSTMGSRNGILGRGWRLSYETTLAAIGDRVQVLAADGTRLIFSRDLLDPSRCSSNDPAHGRIQVRRTRDGDEYVWHKNDGQRLSFNRHGRLVQVMAPTGEFLSMQHDARGWLVKVTDPQGCSLQLNYLDAAAARKADRFSGVYSIDTPVGAVHYDYGSTLPEGADLADRRQLLANLVRVRMPGGGVRAYHYEDRRFPTLMTGISILATDAGGKESLQRFATYGYDANALAVLSTHAGDSGRINLDRSKAGQTVLTNSLGQETVYRYAMLAGARRMTEVRGVGCAQCGEVNVRYGYDALGRMTSVTRLDRGGLPWQADTTRYDHYGRPLEIRRIAYRDGQPAHSRLLARLAYAPGAAPLPSLIARPSVVPGRERETRIRYNEAGQAVERVDSGWAPATDGGAPERIIRATALRYQRVNGRSLLAELDGALPNGAGKQPADSDITRLAWDATGSRVTVVTAPGDFQSKVEYDHAGRLSRVTDESGAVAQAGFDAHGRLISMSKAGIHHSMRFDAAGNLVEQGTGEGDDYRAGKRYGYDAAGRTAWVATALGIVARMEYDSEDRLVKSVQQSARFARERTVRYDRHGRPVEIGDGSRPLQAVAWDARDLPAIIRDGLGRELQLEHDLEGELVRSTPAANVTRLVLPGRSTTYERDADGEVSAVKASNGTHTRYVRDDFGRTIAVVSADSGSTTYRYDAADRLQQTCEADGACASLGYDVAGRIVRRTVTDRSGAASTTAWRYAGRRLAGIDDAAQSEAYAYDANGALATRTVKLHRAGGGSIPSATTFRYDEKRRLVAVSLADGSELAYVRNGQGQVVALERHRIRTPWLRWLLPAQTIVSGLERDIVGLKRIRFGNGVESAYRRAPSGRLAAVVVRAPQAVKPNVTIAERILGIGNANAAEPAQGQTPAWEPQALLDRRYTWDIQGNLLFTREQHATNAYAYDAQDRLIVLEARDAGAGKSAVARYFTDGIGNRLLGQEHDRTSQHAYAAKSSRPRQADEGGRQVGAGAHRYAWQAGGLLAAVSRGEEKLASYRYNYRGERIEKRSAVGTRYFLYQDRKLTAELDGEGRVRRQYVYLGDEPVALLDQEEHAAAPAIERDGLDRAARDLAVVWHEWTGGGARLAFLHNNHLGATEVITDQRGAVLWRARYQPFGRPVVLQQRAGFEFDLRLPGQIEDRETGLFYNDHRYYDPDGGRYISPDPLGLRGGINSYAYAAGNPLRFIDPSGLLLFAFDGTNNSDPPMFGDSSSNVVKPEGKG